MALRILNGNGLAIALLFPRKMSNCFYQSDPGWPMKSNRRIYFIVLTVIVLFIVFGPSLSPLYLSLRYSSADRIEASLPGSGSTSLTGSDAKAVIDALSKAHRRYFGTSKCSFDITLTFYRGPKRLGEMDAGSHVFQIDGSVYETTDLDLYSHFSPRGISKTMVELAPPKPTE
jgi:hypothetical protein